MQFPFISRLHYILTSLFLGMFFSCSLFIPADVAENPAYQKPDRFNFSGILEGSAIQFQNTEFESIFPDDFVFYDGIDGRYQKTEMTSHLSTIATTFPDSRYTLSVKWALISSRNEPTIFTRNDTLSFYRRHIVVIDTISDIPLGSIISDSGNCRIDIAFSHSKNCWSIISWHDEAPLSFFHPRYSVLRP